MRTYTSFLKEEEDKDFRAITAHNNHKSSLRTVQQNAQALADKKKFYREKWQSYAKDADTEAQKRCCKRMLDYIERLTKV